MAGTSQNNFHAVSLSGGKDSTAMLLLMIERNMPIDMVLYADTGMEFPEMYDHIAKLDAYLYAQRGIHITVLRHPQGFEYLMFEEPKVKPRSIENRLRLGVPLYGNGWPGIRVRWCTGALKTKLIDKEVKRLKGELGAIHYIGIAYDEASTTDITDGFAHTGTASSGDVIDYQIISTLPSITSESTYLSCYTFVDTLSKGLTYTKGDVVLEFFTDAECTDLITTWKEADGFFSVAYNTASAGESVMTIEMTERGLSEINASKAVYSGSSMVNSGFSDCTVRITYTAKMDSDNSVVFGDNGNDNKVVLTWKRTSDNYYDTLVDDAHVYTYGIDLTKMFSDGKGDFSKVEFIVQNDSDYYYVQAELNEAEGIYYVVDHTNNPEEATHFIPVESNGNPGKVIIKGLEDDTYTITEIRTDNGYTLLKDDIEIVISQKETTELCDIYESDVLGLIQNDPRYATIINDTGDLKNMPQVHLEHHLLTASATVDGNAVNMLEDNGSKNAEAPLTVVNTRGFDLPETGDHGTMIFTVLGIVAMAGTATVIVLTSKKKNGSR